MEYHSRLDAPLKYHNFNRYFAIPIGIIVFLGSLSNRAYEIGFYNIYNSYDIYTSYIIASLALLITTFVGFLRWKLFGYNCFMIYLAVQLVYGLYCIIIYAEYLPLQTGTAVSSEISILIYSVIVYIYYRKRKLLFAANYNDSYFIVPKTADYEAINANIQAEKNFIPISGQSTVKYCRKCGVPLSYPESRFCVNCGTEINIPAENMESNIAADN